MFLCASEEELVSACACVPDVVRWGNRRTSQFCEGRASTIAFAIRFVILSQIRIFQSIKSICQRVSRLEPKQRFRVAILDSLKFATALGPVAAGRRLRHKPWRPDVPHFRSSIICRRHFRWKSSPLQNVVRFGRSTQRALHRAIHEKYFAQSFAVDDLTTQVSESVRKTVSPASLQPCCRCSQTGRMHSRMSAMDQMTGGCENVEMDGGQLFIFGKKILSNVPKNIVLTPDTDAGLANGAFLGFRSARKAHRQTLPIGVLQDLRFMCCFRFKIWWMTQRMGSFGSEVPFETQFLLIESEDESPADNNFEERKIYTVCLPLLEGAFRTSLQGNVQNELQLCVESGDQSAQTSEGLHSMYINAGPNPFEVIEDAVRAVEGHLQTFARREKKKMPGILDYFGWCTWDAFYTDLTADRVLSGLKSLAEGGTPARFLIIDDGWQSVADEKPKNITVTQGTQYSSRLTSINESEKFSEGGKSSGLQHIVREAKQKLNIKYVYAWHALAGYWGGVQPGLAAMDQYKPTVTYPVHTPTILENQPDMEIDSLTVNGVGLVDPENVSKFYDELHRYLGEAGIDGVKVDAQAILETLGAAFGGRVSVTRKFQQALEASIASNFPDNGCIACMCHNTDTIYSSKQTAVVRASDDFWPRDPASHTIHIASVAYNSVFLGEFMQPDWDMYQSLHPAAEFHAAARAIGGCAVYVSDKPGQHDFDLLKKSVLPDGSVLRARLPGRPTRDSLFTDPARNGSSLLKIWNMNKFGGVIGAFNCQGAGWCKVDKKYAIHDTSPNTITGGIRALDVDYLAKVAEEDWNGDCAIYSHRGGELIRLPKSAVLPITLKVLEYEIFTVAPVKRLRPNLLFVPIGLTKMFNSGGAIQSLSYETYDHDLLQMFGTDGAIEPIEVLKTDSKCIIDCEAVPQATIKMTVHGCGEFGMYSSKEPLTVIVNSKQVPYMYDTSSGFVKFVLAVPVAGHSWDVAVEL